MQEEMALQQRRAALKALSAMEPQPEDMGKRLMELLGPLTREELKELARITKEEIEDSRR